MGKASDSQNMESMFKWMIALEQQSAKCPEDEYCRFTSKTAICLELRSCGKTLGLKIA